jgi:hypothetical protein
MSSFDLPRFVCVLRNDFLQQWKRIWIATLALAGMGLIAYLTNVDPHTAERPALYVALFSTVLIGGGLIFTSTIFADLHHPLQRFHYLTLPCSNLERFLSRYLLTAPLFYLYVLVFYAVFDWLAGVISQALMGKSAAAFAPFEPRMLQVTLLYFGLHALMFGGAIYFRSHAAVKTALSIVVIGFGLVVVQLVSMRIFYWNYFPTLLSVQADIPVPFFTLSPQVMTAVGIVLCLWVLFIAYLCLREHEVQGEL